MSKTIDVESREKLDKYLSSQLKNEPSREVEKVVQQVAARRDMEKMRQEALAVYEKLSMELDVETEPIYSAPNTWSYYSVKELSRGDAMLIDGAIYVYLEKMAWWRNKTANVLVAQHHNPDKQKRIGEIDFVYAYKGYVLAKQMAKMGVTF